MPKSYPVEFRMRAIALVRAGKSIADTARELEIDKGTLSNWVSAWKLNNPEPLKALSPMESARVAEMETGIRRLRMENEFTQFRSKAFVRMLSNNNLVESMGRVGADLVRLTPIEFEALDVALQAA